MLTFSDLGGRHAAILRLTDSNPRAAFQMAQDLASGPTPPDQQSLIAYTQACCLIARERFGDARELLDQAIASFADASDDTIAIYCRHARQLCALFTDAPTATAPWEALIADYRRRGMSRAAIFAAVAQARACYHLRNIGDVRYLVEQWLPAARVEGVAFAEGSLVRLRGVVAQTEGEFERAEADFRQAITIFEGGDCVIEAKHCLLDLAWNRLLQGDIRQAAAWLEHAYAIFTEHDLPLRLALCALNASIVFLHQGRFADALHKSYEARSLFQQLNRPLDIGSCDMQLGRIYGYIGHWTAAVAQLQLAIRTFERYAASGRLASCYYNLAFIRQGNREDSLALEAAEIAQQYALKDQNREILREVAFLQAKILVRTDHIQRANDMLADIEREFVESGNPLGRARCWLEQGWLELARGRPSAARHWFERATESLEPHPVYHWRLLFGLACSYEELGYFADALGTYERAIQLVASFRSQLMNEYLSSFLFMQIASLFGRALACAKICRQGALALRLTEYSRTLTLQRLLDAPLAGVPEPELGDLQAVLLPMLTANAPADAATMARINKHLELYAEKIWLNQHSVPQTYQGVIDIKLAAIHQRLSALHGQEWTVVSYLIYETQLYIITQTPDAIECHQTQWDTETEDLIRELGNPFRHRVIYHDIPYLQGDAGRKWAQLEDLCMRLLPSEVQRRLHADHRLFVIPSGVLHMLSWGTLRVGEAWLCQQAIIQVLPYLGFITRPIGDPTDTMLQIGCSEFGGRAQPLPMTVSEFQTIAAEWAGSTNTLLDGQCQLGRLLDPDSPDRLEKYDVIHIATHAYMHPAHGIMGHIVTHDGELWLNQIMQLRLNNALVVMSTCNGAVVNSLPGEENISLTWGWLMAGARAIVATLWPLADGSTIPLLQRFYGYLAQGCDVALALALAQRECLADPHPSAVDWGNAVVIGMPATIVHRGAGGTRPA